MDVLSSRTLLRAIDPGRSRRFYGETLGLAVCREFGDPDDPGMVFFAGNGLIEIAHGGGGTPMDDMSLWLQVRDVHAERDRLVDAGVVIDRGPTLEPWGLLEMWISDPDGLKIALVEVPPAHPLRRDQR